MKEGLIQKMKALSNECRIDLLLELAKASEPMCVGKLAESIGIAEARVSRGLQILSYAGLVVAKRRGTRVFYNLNADDCVAMSLSRCLAGAVGIHENKNPKKSRKGMVK
ncbi:MAG: winged helix-turn-helix transcriptional regulator [Holophagae bacterium]|nr:winged helix-turn-helix transcriptional regulator [Holophagae bacterium]